MDKNTFSDFEREAMRERAEELRKTKNTEADVLDKISEMTDNEAQIAIEIHNLVKKIAPELKPKTWYSMLTEMVKLFYFSNLRPNSKQDIQL